jgi:flagellar protein FlaG
MSLNMEVIDVYVDSVAGSMAVPTQTPPVQSASQSGSAKSNNTTDTPSNVARTDSTDGGQQAAQVDGNGTVYEGQTDNRTDEEKTAADNEKIKKALENMTAQLPNSEVKFGIHEKTNRVTIKLVDKSTKEVIKEFPPEKTLDMIAKCMEIAGVLVDEKL